MRLLLIPLYAIVFATGSAGLIYQVAWQKYLSRLFGSDSIATAIILATFLGGLSLGYYLCGKLTTRVEKHFKAYAMLEGIIAAWALLFPNTFRIVESFSRSWSFSFPILIVVQGFICSAILIGIPTVCMGGTIPFLTRGISRNLDESTGVHATVYAINTAGAFLGTLIAGFYLIPEYGLPMTVMGTAVLNLSAFVFFYFIPNIRGTDDMSEAISQEDHFAEAPKFSPVFLYLIVFLSGFYVMTLENVFIRLTNLSLGSSSYSFSMIVSVFILAIAIGSYVVGRLKILAPNLLYINQISITLLLLLIYFSLDTWTYWAHLIRVSFQSNIAGFWSYYAFVFIVLGCVLIVPVGFMGATVPIAFHELRRDLKNVGKHSGQLFSWNTIGNLTGSLIGGIVFFYLFNMGTIFILTAVCAALSACLSARCLPKRYLVSSLIVLLISVSMAFFTPAYHEKRLAIGTFRVTAPKTDSFKGPDGFFKKFYQYNNILYYKDDPTSTVAVSEKEEKHGYYKTSMSIYVNGKSDSSTGGGDVPTLKLLAHIPALLAEKRDNTLVIGLGTGVTAGELTLYPDMKHIDVAEISPAVADALPYFGEYNHQVHTSPKIRIHIADAFRVLGRSTKKWDIVISEPSNPWVSGVDMLFTQEFYRLVKEHLTPGGVLLQWIHTYSFEPQLLNMVVNTIRQEFGFSRVFIPTEGDLCILASDTDIPADRLKKASQYLQQHESVRKSLQMVKMDKIEHILLREIWTPSYIQDHFYNAGIQTMDNPRLHYLAGKSLFLEKHVPSHVLFNSDTANYSDEYLLSKLYPDWNRCPFSEEQFQDFLNSYKEIEGRNIPAFVPLKLRGYLCNPDKYPLSDEEKKSFKTEVLHLITGKEKMTSDSIPDLKDKSLRYRIELLLDYLNYSRLWLVPYPTDGLKNILKEAIAGHESDQDKNWYVMYLTKLMVGEKAKRSDVEAVLVQMKRGRSGKLILNNEDVEFAKEFRNILQLRYQMDIEIGQD